MEDRKMSKEFEVLDQFVELTDKELKEIIGGQYKRCDWAI